jgi:hypothetical protein
MLEEQGCQREDSLKLPVFLPKARARFGQQVAGPRWERQDLAVLVEAMRRSQHGDEGDILALIYSDFARNLTSAGRTPPEWP